MGSGLDSEVVGLVVLVPEPDYMLLKNIAVAPEKQPLGLGRRLIEFAEASARQRGYREIQLYTNELMHENLAWYASLGYQQISRRLNSGFKRVFLQKPATYIIDRNRIVRRKFIGAVDWNQPEIVNFLSKL